MGSEMCIRDRCTRYIFVSVTEEMSSRNFLSLTFLVVLGDVIAGTQPDEAADLLVQLLSSKIAHFCDKSMKLCMITTSHVKKQFLIWIQG